MNGAPFAAIGGSLACDHGPLTLVQARALANFYDAEAAHCRSVGAMRAGEICVARADALRRAATAATLWRRAAGWVDPNAADVAYAGSPRRSRRA